MVTFCKPNFTFVRKKSKNQAKELDTNFVILAKKYDCTIHESSLAKTNQDSAISQTRENSKMFKIVSKYFRFLKNMPPGS